MRTDNPQAELGLFEDQTELAHETWHAHRELSVTLHKKITELLQTQNRTLGDLQGIVIYEGPGSFTGLRIGMSVANALAYGLDVPIVASGGDAWQQTGLTRLQRGERDPLALPQYGAPVHITKQKK